MPRAREGVPTSIDYDTHAVDEQSGHMRRRWQRVPHDPVPLELHVGHVLVLWNRHGSVWNAQ